MEFTRHVFHAEVSFSEPQDSGEKIRHAEVRIGGVVIMFADATEQWGEQPAGLFVYADNADETYRLALAHGATSVMEPSDREYGRACGVKDPVGNTWWITSLPD